MNDLQQREVQCPYCGESMTVFIDRSVPQQNYIEDCQVCCRPIIFNVTIDCEGDINIIISHEND